MQQKGSEIDSALRDLQKRFGKHVVYDLEEGPGPTPYAASLIPTGFISLDWVLDGGILPGRVMEIFGPEGVGKTTLVYHLAAAVQRARPGEKCVFVNTEYAFDDDYYMACGGDSSQIIIVNPDDGDQALEATRKFVEAGSPLVIVDSVAGLVPKAELEGAVGDRHIGLMARLMNQSLRIIGPGASRTGSIVIFVNQIRYKIGVTFGNPETTPGGQGLRFHSSVRLDMRRVRSVKSGTDIIGAETRIKCLKNKWGMPWRTAVVEIRFGEGIQRVSDLVNWGDEKGVLVKRGSYYYYIVDDVEVTLGQGRVAATQYLIDHPDLAREVEWALRGALGLVREEKPDSSPETV